ncbi:MAG: SigE family RNA polymerase sigma factor [Actinomycetota bacterium]|nr:SigE family RNA polymerase sigma factor [Actinomycetota bacterium]
MNPVSGGRIGKRLEEEYSWFFRGEYQSVLRTAFLIVGDRESARDVTQEAFIRLFRYWKKVSTYDRPDAWVRHVAVRLAIQLVRRRRLHDLLTPAPESTHIVDSVIWEVQEAVKELPPTQRAAVALFYFEDRPSAEIARILDCSESTVRVHLHKARKKLATVLKESQLDVG